MSFSRRALSLLATVFAVGGAVLMPLPQAQAQAGFDDDRVMLQGFYWESHRYGHPEKFANFPNTAWYDFVRSKASSIRAARFDLIWLPSPALAANPGEYSAGYNPRELYDLNNTYGSSGQQRQMLEALLRAGIEPVADIVINHRNTTGGWARFKNPDWGSWAVCSDDEAFFRDNSDVKDLPMNQRGQPEEKPIPYGVGYGDGKDYAYPDFRDIDHTNTQVRRDILRYLLGLKSYGYRGWRYDMVHGYQARWVALYNKRTRPTFSVGEYDWGRESEQRGWSWYTATTPGQLTTSSDVFDFALKDALKNALAQPNPDYKALYGLGNGLGLMGDNTDGIAWKQRAATFIENHDTGYRTEENGQFEQGHQFDSFAKGPQVERAYAYVLTHPGIPCVYWKHYFEWGSDLQTKIRSLINARKVAGVNAGSALNLQNNARARGVYAAMIQGTKGQLYVRIGGEDAQWKPSNSGYSGYREYANGANWRVWVGLPGNPAKKQQALKGALPIPTIQPFSSISIPDSWLN